MTSFRNSWNLLLNILVIVINRSGFPYFATRAMAFKYRFLISLGPPTKDPVVGREVTVFEEVVIEFVSMLLDKVLEVAKSCRKKLRYGSETSEF